MAPGMIRKTSSAPPMDNSNPIAMASKRPLINAIVETPLKVGEQIVDSIFGPGAWSGQSKPQGGEEPPKEEKQDGE